jgi:hypothetical protein
LRITIALASRLETTQLTTPEFDAGYIADLPNPRRLNPEPFRQFQRLGAGQPPFSPTHDLDSTLYSLRQLHLRTATAHTSLTSATPLVLFVFHESLLSIHYRTVIYYA